VSTPSFPGCLLQAGSRVHYLRAVTNPQSMSSVFFFSSFLQLDCMNQVSQEIRYGSYLEETYVDQTNRTMNIGAYCRL
jgi:hypothetical protein